MNQICAVILPTYFESTNCLRIKFLMGWCSLLFKVISFGFFCRFDAPKFNSYLSTSSFFACKYFELLEILHTNIVLAVLRSTNFPVNYDITWKRICCVWNVTELLICFFLFNFLYFQTFPLTIERNFALLGWHSVLDTHLVRPSVLNLI